MHTLALYVHHAVWLLPAVKIRISIRFGNGRKRK